MTAYGPRTNIWNPTFPFRSRCHTRAVTVVKWREAYDAGLQKRKTAGRAGLKGGEYLGSYWQQYDSLANFCLALEKDSVDNGWWVIKYTAIALCRDDIQGTGLYAEDCQQRTRNWQYERLLNG